VPSRPTEGRCARHERGAGCGGRGGAFDEWRFSRTAKSCGSDAPMLASSLREEAQATVSNKPGRRGERGVSRKTIARGMPGDFRCTCGDYTRVLTTLHTRLRVHWAPGIPCALCFQKAGRSWQTSRETRGEIAKLCSTSLRGAQRRSNLFFLCAARWIASLTLAMTVSELAV
jgi:hypothetical protein